MAKQIKRLNFADNAQGLKWVDVNMTSWEIVDACAAGRHLIKRACRLVERGQHLEYRNGASYVRLPAKIEMAG